jgi:hypothetical protein
VIRFTSTNSRLKDLEKITGGYKESILSNRHVGDELNKAICKASRTQK